MAAYETGHEAIARHNDTGAVAAFEQAIQLAPTFYPAIDELAEAEAHLGHNDRAVALLRRSIALGSLVALGADTNATFAQLRDRASFVQVRTLIKRASRRVARSKETFRLTQRDLIPEGVAYDPGTGAFFVSSTYRRKVVHIARDGTVSDFTTGGQDGMWGAVGIRVDSVRRALWVLSSSTDGMTIEGYRRDEDGCSSAFQYGLDTRRLVAKYVLCHDSLRHFFNDLAITGSGDVYITDSQLGAVYRIPVSTKRLELFLGPSTFTDPNGLALTPDDRRLFVAHETGVDIVDLSTRRHAPLVCPASITVAGIDGLAFWRTSLVAVQPDLARVSRFQLSPDLDRVIGIDVLDFRRPEFGQPTEGVVVGDAYYYSADAQFASFDHGVIYPRERLRDVVILRAPLVER